MRVLRINPQVFDDLKNIREYIEKDDPFAAKNVIDSILEDIGRLKSFPDIGAKLSTKVRQKTRYKYIITYSYATLYYLEKDAIIVTTVVHLSRDLNALRLEMPK